MLGGAITPATCLDVKQLCMGASVVEESLLAGDWLVLVANGHMAACRDCLRAELECFREQDNHL